VRETNRIKCLRGELGRGLLRDELLRYVRENRLEGVVKVCSPVGSAAEMREYVGMSDVWILSMPDHPWWRYQVFLKSLELVSMKKPLIVSDIPANRWVIGNAPVAFYLKEATENDIADGRSVEKSPQISPWTGSPRSWNN